MRFKTFVKKAIKAVLPHGLVVIHDHIKLGILSNYIENLLHRSKRTKYEITLAATTLVMNEAPYLREWIEYHKIMGVEKFYIFDNYSTDNIKKVLRPYILSGEVEYILFPSIEAHSPSIQPQAFTTAVRKARLNTHWLAVLDVDEFIVPVKYNLIEFLNNLPNHTAAVELPWVLYGFNSNYKKPDGLVIENYPKRWDGQPFEYLPENLQWINNQVYKSIVRPDYVLSYGVHRGDYLPFMKIETLTPDAIRLNHYWTKSWEEWCSKCPKKDVEYSEMNGDKYRLITRYDPCFLSNTEDRIIEKYLPELKNRMNEINHIH